MKLLLAEDEPKVQKFILQAFQEKGWAVDATNDIGELLTSLASFEYDVLILDRLLKGVDALDFLPKIRQQQSKIKILILSALSDVEDKVAALSQGADDYLTKPFHVSELLARVQVLVRRGEEMASGGFKKYSLQFKDLSIDLERQVAVRAGQKIELSAKEFKLLCLLARNPGRIYSKTQLLDQVWGINFFPESNVVEVTVANLRQKLGSKQNPLIFSKRGIGYWLGGE
ncbi:MAG: response regulator transcription factor [Deltaproteobacteria bacterium]|nr:response regulator transcription factor [Deltaproteobacteria bacterium]